MKRKELKEKKQNRKNKGITLIALVVTIVVLLILAGVSISMLGGENGIITQAIEAKDENEKAEEKEKVQLAVTAAKGKTNWGEITEENLAEELTKNIGERDTDYTLTKDGDKFIVTYTDSNRSYEVDKNGNVTGPTNSDDNPGGGGAGSLTPGNRYDEDTDLTIGDDKITIPGGATISKIPGEYEDIDEGIVIYIIPEDETPDWNADTNSNGIKDVQEKYDQFVWVPVKNAVLDLSGNSAALASDDSIKAAVQSEIDAGRYPMAIKKDAENYFGVLYEFNEATDTEENKYVKITTYRFWEPTSTNSGYREPAYLTNSNNVDGSSFNNTNPKVTETLLQTEFNTMATRVANKGGFWVGRYETSSIVSSNTQDATNRVTVIRGTTTGINNVNWYRMYAQQKAYESLVLTESASVTSSMIWGSQWDQIMIWMKGIENEAKSSYYIINSLTMGNFGTSDDTDSSTSEPALTGNSENYKVKNVFDLAGNVREWTLEGSYTSSRVFRGGYYENDSNNIGGGERPLGLPDFNYSRTGTRATLY